MRPLTHRMYLLAQALSLGAEEILRAGFDLGFTDYLALHGVASGRASSQSELAAFVGVTDAGISRIVSRLVDRDLLQAAPDPSNRRRVLLALTGQGAKVVKAAGVLLEARFDRRAQTIAKREDFAAFERVLDALLAEMERKP